MQQEGTAGYRSRTSPAEASIPVQRLSRSALRGGPLSILERTIEPVIAEALDAVEAEAFPPIRHATSTDEAEPAVRRRLSDYDFGPEWLREWLAQDVGFLARLFHELTGARRLLVRLESVKDDSCRRFHIDNVRFRLVTTYRGPGTQWVAPAALALQAAAGAIPLEAIRQLERGWVAVMRGGRDALPDQPGLLHRSPPVAGSGPCRLFLAIDDAADR